MDGAEVKARAKSVVKKMERGEQSFPETKKTIS